MRSWTTELAIVDHGMWEPSNDAACAAVIAEVTRLRMPDDPRPVIRHDTWGDRKVWLSIKLGETSIRLDPGEHLVSVTTVTGETIRTVMYPDELVSLGAPAEGSLGC